MFEHLAKVTASYGAFPARHVLSFGRKTLTNTPAKSFSEYFAVSSVVQCKVGVPAATAAVRFASIAVAKRLHFNDRAKFAALSADMQ